MINSTFPTPTYPAFSFCFIEKNYDINIQRNSPPIFNRLLSPGPLYIMPSHLHQAHQQLDLQPDGVHQLCAENEKFLHLQN